MPPKAKAGTIVTLDSLAGQNDRDGALGGDTALAAALRQLTNTLNQTAAASLPTGTHVDYTAAAPETASAFQGLGRVLGRMYGSSSNSSDANIQANNQANNQANGQASGQASGQARGHYNLRPRRRRGNSAGEDTEADGGQNGHHSEQYDDPNDGDYVEDTNRRRASSDSQTTHSAVVVSDNIDQYGVRRVEMELPTSPKPVTVLFPAKTTVRKKKPAPKKSTGRQRPSSTKGRGRKKRKATVDEADDATAVETVLPPEIHLPGTPRSPELPSPGSVAPPPTPISDEAPPAAVHARSRLSATVEDVEDVDPRSIEAVITDETMQVGDRLSPDFLEEYFEEDNHNDDEINFDVAGQDWYGNLFVHNLFDEQDTPHRFDAVDRRTTHAFRGHEQPSVGERLEQALTYLTEESAASDSQWHERVAELQEYLNFLQGNESLDKDVDTGPYAGVDGNLAEDVALAEAEEAAAAAKDEIRALGGRDDSAFSEERPPSIRGTNTKQLLEDVRQLIHAHREFEGHVESTHVPARASILGAVDGQINANSPPLQALLETWGRPFVGRLIVDDEVARVDQDAGQLRENENENALENDVDDALFHVDFNDLQETAMMQLETHPYTVQMARYRRLRQYWMQQARTLTEQVHGNTPGWATLPPFEDAFGLGYGDVRQGNDSHDDIGDTLAPRQPLPAPMEHDRRLLVLLRSIGRLLLLRLDVAPRPLLDEVNRYIEQGLRGDSQPDASLQLRERYDHHGQQQAAAQTAPAVRRINETEARWLQFLLSESTNAALAAPLPRGPHLEEDEDIHPDDTEDIAEKTLEEGSRALYHVFAQRLQALLDDRGSNSLGGMMFPTANTRLPVSILVKAMNSMSGDGSAATQTHFSVYDALHFLSRLSRAGRCRFVHHPFEQTFGYVQRPLLNIHPEHRIHPAWADRTTLDSADGRNDTDASIGAPRRTRDVDSSWAETVASGRAAENAILAPDVRTFFCALAFRYGRTLHELETQERPRWERWLQEAGGREQNRGNSQSDAMRRSLRTLRRTYERLLRQHNVLQEAEAAGIPATLVDVVRLADPITYVTKSSEVREGLTEEVARAIVHHHLLEETASGQATPLTGTVAALSAHNGSRDSNNGLWDWALPSIAGEAPAYFHMDRWPLHLQTQTTAARVADEARIALDPELLWDPASEDPAGVKYMWLFSGPGYGYQRTTETHPQYLMGETELQRQVLVQDLTRRVAAEAGIDLDEGEEESRGFLGWLRCKMPFRKRKRSEVEDDVEDGEGEEDEGEGEEDEGDAGDAGHEDADSERGGKRPRVIIFRETPLPTVSAVPKSIDWMSLVRKCMGTDTNDADHEDSGEDDGGSRSGDGEGNPMAVDDE